MKTWKQKAKNKAQKFFPKNYEHAVEKFRDEIFLAVEEFEIFLDGENEFKKDSLEEWKGKYSHLKKISKNLIKNLLLLETEIKDAIFRFDRYFNHGDLLRKQKNREIREVTFLKNVGAFCLEANTSLEDLTNWEYFFNYTKKENWKNNWQELYKEVKKGPKIEEDFFPEKLKEIKKFLGFYEDLEEIRSHYNNKYIEEEKKKHKKLFDNIDGKSLDNQQREAVIVDEDNNLVLAGAGAGKTLTISAKVKYLVEEKECKPNEILLISFTKKAAEEMQERIGKKLNIDVQANTFHKLGLEIIAEARNLKPNVFDDFPKVIEEYFKEEIAGDKKALLAVIKYLNIFLQIPQDLGKFKNLGEMYDYNLGSDFETIKSKVEWKEEKLKKEKTTIKGETVKSIEEVIIANFLFLNGVKYTYEKKYPHVSGNQFKRGYKPDFYLDDYDIYIEHFGINKNNRAPWLSDIQERKYLEQIKWKRKLHKEKETVLLETYSHYNNDGILLSKLDEKLKIHKVKYKEVDYEELYRKLFLEKEDRKFKEFKKLIQTFIDLFKSQGHSEEDFSLLRKEAKKEKNKFLRERTLLFLSIVEPIYHNYQKTMEELWEIDFNDMINLATEYIKGKKVKRSYEYIIIDEYQDISVSRFKLVKEIKNQTGAKVIAVGDDWQSIFRFAGSDISLFTRFEDYLGESEILKIERTYRNSQKLVDIAGDFIMENPKQLKKKLISDKRHSNPIRILGYDSQIGEAVKYAIEEIVRQYGERTFILILGRNNFDIEMLEPYKEFKINRKQDGVLLNYTKYPKLKMAFLTAHRSKGLEADNVIVINLENRIVGFPNKIADDPILSLVLTDNDEYDFAEERRLFYVAITRTKNSTYLITPDKKQSIFVEEMIEKYKINCSIPTGEPTIQNNPNCDRCQKGHLVLRESSVNESQFLGCSNYPFCNNTFKEIEILEGHIKCNFCGGYMVIRNGKNGKFYGCTNYPLCDNKFDIEKKYQKS